MPQQKAVNEGWSEAENHLQRRNDLTPNLVNTVKGLASQEKQVHTELTAARSRVAGAGNPQQAPEAPSLELRAHLLRAASR